MGHAKRILNSKFQVSYAQIELRFEDFQFYYHEDRR